MLQVIVSMSAAVIGVGVIRFKPDDFAVVSDCFVVLLQVIVSISAVVIDVGVIRFKPDDFAVVSDRFVVLLQVIVSISAIIMGVGVIRFEPDGFGVVGDRFVVLFRVHVVLRSLERLGKRRCGIRRGGAARRVKSHDTNESQSNCRSGDPDWALACCWQSWFSEGLRCGRLQHSAGKNKKSRTKTKTSHSGKDVLLGYFSKLL